MGIFYLLPCKVTESIYVYYFSEEILFNFQVIINKAVNNIDIYGGSL